MNTFGRYCLSYDPRPEFSSEYKEPDIRMSIDSEADLNEMCRFFNSFLKAAGYIYDGEVEIVTQEPSPAPTLFDAEDWEDTGFLRLDDWTQCENG